jgi:crotonobetainyl-CoA:carnitine CoA-transferase CaiB-like acyl-CoA transferase
MSVNRNKRSIAIDLTTEEGRDIIRDMVQQADVLIENFRVGKMDEWNLGYEDLRELNADLIYCSLSGYGEWGPDNDRPAYDIIMQAEGGLMSITGVEDGAPVRVGVAIADIGAAMYATQAILAALLDREFSDSGGQKIDISLLDGQVAWMTYMASNYFATDESPGRMGSTHPTSAPYQAFETADGYVVVAVASENIWERFCSAIDCQSLANDTRFKTNADRVSNREVLDELLAEELIRYTTEEILKIMRSHDVPASQVHDMEQVFDNPQVQARGMHTSVTHPTAGSVEMPGSPMHFSRTPTTIRKAPPLLGEHSRELLREYGYSETQINELVSHDIIAPLEQ